MEILLSASFRELSSPWLEAMTGDVDTKCVGALCNRHYLHLLSVNLAFPFIYLSQAVLDFPVAFTDDTDTKSLVPNSVFCNVSADPYSGEGMSVSKHRSFTWKSISGEK